MKAPDKIYIFQDGDELWYKPEEWETPPPNRVEYIYKDALLEWLNKAKIKVNDDGIRAGFQIVISKINSL